MRLVGASGAHRRALLGVAILTLSISEFFEQIEQFPDAVPIDELVPRMRDVELSLDDIADVTEFHDECYARNLWRCGPGYSAFILCWKPGQASPIHDHQGSACGVRVLQGEVTETTFVKTPDGPLAPDRTTVYPTGMVCGSYDTDIHLIANRDPGDLNLITFHVYTPPLKHYRVFQAEGSFEMCLDSAAPRIAKVLGAAY